MVFSSFLNLESWILILILEILNLKSWFLIVDFLLESWILLYSWTLDLFLIHLRCSLIHLSCSLIFWAFCSSPLWSSFVVIIVIIKTPLNHFGFIMKLYFHRQCWAQSNDHYVLSLDETFYHDSNLLELSSPISASQLLSLYLTAHMPHRILA